MRKADRVNVTLPVYLIVSLMSPILAKFVASRLLDPIPNIGRVQRLCKRIFDKSDVISLQKRNSSPQTEKTKTDKQGKTERKRNKRKDMPEKPYSYSAIAQKEENKPTQGKTITITAQDEKEREKRGEAEERWTKQNERQIIYMGGGNVGK